MPKISIHEPSFIGNEKKYLKECITEGWVSTSGSFINRFENKIIKFLNIKYCLALNSCSSALHLAILALGIKKNEEIIVPTITFISPINAILYNNSIPVFMDCSSDFNIDIKKTIDFINNETKMILKNKEKITINKKTNRKIAAIIIVHTFGNAAAVHKLVKLCKLRKIRIIEDAAESLGTNIKYQNKISHTGTFGDIGCISFNGNKIITSGGGGALVTNNYNLFKKVKHISAQSKIDPINYVHDQIGYNYRISNLQAALGLAQFEKINIYLNKKKKILNFYNHSLKNEKNFNIMSSNEFSISNNWINILRINNIKIKKETIFNKFKKNNIETRSVWFPNHLQQHLKKFQKYKITNSYKLFNNSICLPSSFRLNNKELKKIIDCLLNL